ncbi:MAG TPA: hypothetical protein VGG36_13065 [Rhizomicrobium sp.]|jgi:hypothetical protein
MMLSTADIASRASVMFVVSLAALFAYDVWAEKRTNPIGLIVGLVALLIVVVSYSAATVLGVLLVGLLLSFVSYPLPQIVEFIAKTALGTILGGYTVVILSQVLFNLARLTTGKPTHKIVWLKRTHR